MLFAQSSRYGWCSSTFGQHPVALLTAAFVRSKRLIREVLGTNVWNYFGVFSPVTPLREMGFSLGKGKRRLQGRLGDELEQEGVIETR